jgi:hypothetical protein
MEYPATQITIQPDEKIKDGISAVLVQSARALL